MKKSFLFLLTVLLLVSCGGKGTAVCPAGDDPARAANFNKNYPIVDSLLRVMTLDEKIGQLVLYTSDWDVTGPSIRDGYVEDIRAGKSGFSY